LQGNEERSGDGRLPLPQVQAGGALAGRGADDVSVPGVVPVAADATLRPGREETRLVGAATLRRLDAGGATSRRAKGVALAGRKAPDQRRLRTPAAHPARRLTNGGTKIRLNTLR